MAFRFNPFTGTFDIVEALPHDILSTIHTDTLAGAVVRGDIIFGNGTPKWARKAVGTGILHADGTDVLGWSLVVEGDISLSNVTTNNATTAQHGFLPILSNNAAQFLNGQGNFATPSGTPNSYLTQAFSAQTSVNVVHNFGSYPIVQVLDSTKALLIPLTVTHNTLNDFTVTFNVSTTGTIIASIGSPQPQSVIIVTNNYVVLQTDYFVKINATGKTVTLPTAVGHTGRTFIIDSVGTNTVDTTGGEFIEGSLTQSLTPNSAMLLYSDGTGWRIF